MLQGFRHALLPTALAASVLLAWPAAPARAAPPYVDAELSYAHDDNLGHAARAHDAVDDDAALARARVNWLRPLGARSGLRASLGADYQAQARWQDVGHGGLDGQLTWRFKPGGGFAAPWFEAAAAGAVQQFQDSALRDGGRLTLDLATGSALTDRLGLRLGYRYTLMRAWREAVFDGDQQRVYGHLEWRAARATLYTTVGWQHGDVVSVAEDNRLLERDALAHADDPALSDAAHPRVAYRFTADTWTGGVGVNLPLAARLACDVSATWFDAESDAGSHYRGYRLVAGLLFRY